MTLRNRCNDVHNFWRWLQSLNHIIKTAATYRHAVLECQAVNSRSTSQFNDDSKDMDSLIKVVGSYIRNEIKSAEKHRQVALMMACPIDEHRRSAVLLLITVYRSKRKEGGRIRGQNGEIMINGFNICCVWIHISAFFSTLNFISYVAAHNFD